MTNFGQVYGELRTYMTAGHLLLGCFMVNQNQAMVISIEGNLLKNLGNWREMA